MIPMVYPWCHNTISNQKNIKEKSGSQSGHPVETPDKDLRRARKALPGGPGGDEKWGFPEREPDGNPGNEKGPPGSQRLDRETRYV